MNDTEKINNKLDRLDTRHYSDHLAQVNIDKLVTALRIALDEFRKVNKESANVYLARKWLQKAEHEIAEALEGKL
jgi:hypothetical protein